MTRTEERLHDALHAEADRVRDDRLRPLPGLGPGAEPGRRRRPAPAWLIPAAAAASVVLVIGLVMVVTGGPRHPAGSGRTSAAAGRTGSAGAGFPTYFVQLTGKTPPGPTLEVRSTSTGSVLASARFPVVRGWSLILNTEAAAPDGRTFYVAYDADRAVKSSITEQVWIYRLSVTSSGSATPLTRIKGGEISGSAALGTGGSMAVSPDGTRLALTADSTNQLENNTEGWADKIIVIDLKTGTRSVWQGGLYRSGKTFTIPDISWTPGGRSLVFLGLWCDFPPATALCGDTPGPQEYRDTQVRSLSTGTGGGTLDRSAVLLTQSARYPVIAAAVAGPDPAELTVVVLSGKPGSFGSWSKVAVDRVSAVNGSLLGVTYHATAIGGEGQPDGVTINPDPSGRYLLLSYSGPGGLYTGWLGSGKLHFLPIKQPYLGQSIGVW
jgi:hypothetical protein